jgi:preprotein translocase subunit SecF
MRVLVAGLIGGILMFAWGAAAHMALGLGDIGIRLPANENVVLSTLQEGLGSQPGVYILPSLDPKQMGDAAVVKAYAEKAVAAPYAWVVYLPQGENMLQMGPQIGRQWASDTLAALALAFVLGLAGLGFRRRVAVAAAAAVFAWLSTTLPYWNWYHFPLDFTLAALVEQLIGWLLAGAAMAWWLGRRERKLAG